MPLMNAFRIWVNIVPPDGVPRRIAGYSGESLLDLISRNKIPGIFRMYKYECNYVLIADCNGGDAELKPYQVPIDFFSAGVACA